MEGKRRIVERRAASTTTTKNFKRLLYGAIGIVLSSYMVLFILVVSRHLDQSAENELRISAVESAAAAGGRTGSKGKKHQLSAKPSRFVGGIGPSLLGMDRFHERWAAVARIMAVNEASPSHPRRKVNVCSQPRFRNPPGPVTALASFPGSGNTWVRFLAQQATGILTGSVYKDYSLKRNGFPAEKIANGSVLLVKTHEWGEAVRKQFDKAVLLIRDPYDALVAEFNRRAGGHVGHAAADKFLKGNAWKNFTMTQSRVWMTNILDWLQFEGPLMILRYEIVTSELPTELVRLLRFLNVTVTWPTFQCVLRNREGIFRRAKKPMTFEPFDESVRHVIDGYKAIVERALRLHEQGIRFNVNNLTASNSDSVGQNQTLDGGQSVGGPGGVPVTYLEQTDVS